MTEIAAPSEFRNLWKRTVTAVVLIAVALGALLVGKWSFWLLSTLLAVAMTAEWAALMKVERWKALLAVAAIIGLLAFAHPLYRPIDEMNLLVLAGAGAAVMLAATSLRLAAGFLYIGLATLAIVFLREQGGLMLTFWTLAIVWGTDIGAYFSGKAIGGPKLAPALSPNKTWAGLIGGVLSAAAVSAVFVLNGELLPWLILLAAGLAVLAQLGDLYESWLKRRADVKDSSKLFPGHGGALDRLDGLLPVAICVAALAGAGAIA